MIKLENCEFELEEKYVNEEYGNTTLYFIGPKEMIIKDYPEAESTEISIEFPTSIPHSEYATVMISPTKDGLDYDWSDKYFIPEEIDNLINYGLKDSNRKEREQ